MPNRIGLASAGVHRKGVSVINDELDSELVKVRQALANALAVEKQLEQQVEKSKVQMSMWEKRIETARSRQQEEMAVQAEEQVKKLKTMETQLQVQLMSQHDFTEQMKKDLSKLEARRFSSGGASGKEALAAADSTLSTIARMENKIVEHESLAELTAPDPLAQQFARQEDPIEQELQALKEQASKNKKPKK